MPASWRLGIWSEYFDTFEAPDSNARSSLVYAKTPTRPASMIASKWHDDFVRRYLSGSEAAVPWILPKGATFFIRMVVG